MATIHAPAARWRNDRLFFSGMALLILLIVFAGFAPTYYLSRWTGAPSLPPLAHLHGILFTAWIGLFVAQTSLVAARRTAVHRRLGAAGAGLAVLMVVIGTWTAIAAARRGAFDGFGDSTTFLIVPLTDVLFFAPVVFLAIRWRRHSETHKRLMLLATLSLTGAAFARFPAALASHGPLFFFGTIDALILVAMAYDRLTRGRVHPVWIWGGAALLASQVGRLMLMPTDFWRSIAEFLV